jgi:hypothetical protein
VVGGCAAQNDARLRITSLSVHRLLVTAVLIAAKFLDDSYFNNAYYSKVRREAQRAASCSPRPKTGA